MIQHLISLLLALLCLAGIWRTARLALADYYSGRDRATATRLERAIGLERGEAAYLYQLATLPDSRDEQESMGHLQRVLLLNPRFTRARLELALRQESVGDLPKAEVSLLAAADADRRWSPRWALANYYLRRSDLAGFWRWIRLAAAVPYRDPDPVFSLCWRVSRNAAEILEHAIPPDRDIRKRYLAYLLRESRLDAAEPLAGEIGSAADAADHDLLLRYCDRMLEAKRPSAATAVWNAMARRGVLPYQPLDASAGASLTNGELSAEPLSRGFDWRILEISGVSTTYFRGERELKVTLSGRQPESCEILKQFLPVEPHRQYTLRVRYRLERLAANHGLWWRIHDALGSELTPASAPLAGEDGTAATVSFSTPAACSLVILTLHYTRPSGAMRAEGNLAVQHIAIDRNPW